MNKTPIVSDSGSFWIQRVLAGAGALAFGALALWTRPSVPISLASATVAIICCWFVLRGHLAESRERAGTTLTGAILFGAIGVLGGVIGISILKPTAPEAPVFGIIIIGPLCFVLGAIAGCVYAHIRHSIGSHRE